MLRLFTRSPQVKKRSVDDTTGLQDDIQSLRNRVHRLEIEREELRAEMDSLLHQVRSVRGRLTGGIRRAQEEENQPAGKDALRLQARQLGLIK